MRYLGILILLLIWDTPIRAEEEDDDIKGPLIKPKEGGGLWTTAEIIEQNGYKQETHDITTQKGYKLKAFRVLPKGEPSRGEILVQHGYLLSSDVFVSDADALAFKLSEAGYSVWLPNLRGNAYSRSHEKLSPDQKEFWDFSFHDMAVDDLPDVIDYIINKAKVNSIYFLGHSLGVSLGFILASQRPEYNEKLKCILGLAPTIYLSKPQEMVGTDGMVEEMAGNFVKDFKSSGKSEVFPRKDIPENPKNQITCQDVGDSFKDMCSSKMEEAQGVLGGAYLPAGTSLNTLLLFFQCAQAGELRKFKYDTPEENKKVYGTEEPPSYIDSFSQLKQPVAIWSSPMDQVVMPEDIDKLVGKIPNLLKDTRLEEVECFDHVAFLFPRQKSCMPKRAEVYNGVIEVLKSLG